MTDYKISDLPPASQANPADQIEANQGGVSRRVTAQQIAALAPLANYAALTGSTFTGTIGWSAPASLTTNTPVLSFGQQWNAGSVNFDAIVGNVTDNASGPGSKLIHLQRNGSDVFVVDKLGNIQTASGIQAAGSGYFQTTSGLPAGGDLTKGLFLSGVANFGIIYGHGAANKPAAPGTLYLRDDGAPEFYSASGWQNVGTSGLPALPNLLGNGITKLWQFNTPGGELIFSSPIGPVTIRRPGGVLTTVVLVNAWDWYSYALDVTNGAVIYNKATGNTIYGRSQAADVNGDGLPEIFVPSHDGYIHCFNDDFTNKWTFPNLYFREATGTVSTRTAPRTFTDTSKAWATNSFMRMTAVPPDYPDTALENATITIPSIGYTGQVLSCSGSTMTVFPDFTTLPAVGAAYTITPRYDSDIDFMHAGTLTKEGSTWFLYVTSFDNCLYKLNANTGALVWKYATLENIEPYPLLADVNNDGAREILTGSIDGTYRCFKTDGTLLWQNTDIGPIDAFGNAGDINGDGKLEIILSARDGRMHVLNGQTGAELSRSTPAASWDFPEINSSSTPILIDGQPRIYCGGDAGTVWCFDVQGNTIWQTFVVPFEINSSPIFHDVDGDGTVEVIVGDMRGTIWVLNARTGAIVGVVYVKNGIEGVPLYADIDGDGKMEMVVTTLDGAVIAYRFEKGAAYTQPYLPGNARWQGYV